MSYKFNVQSLLFTDLTDEEAEELFEIVEKLVIEGTVPVGRRYHPHHAHPSHPAVVALLAATAGTQLGMQLGTQPGTQLGTQLGTLTTMFPIAGYRSLLARTRSNVIAINQRPARKAVHQNSK
jgi:hypothetical protein